MKTIIFEDPKEIAAYILDALASSLKKKPSLTLALPTGKTTIPLYKKIVSDYKKKKLDFSKTKTFQIDEYLNNKNDFRKFLIKNLLSKINVKKENQNFISTENPEEPREYEQKISKAKIDLMLLGIGVNCHIAFNEPGSPFDSKTRIVSLTQSTQRANKTKIKSALTIGISTILKSKKIILIATGKHKAQAVKEMIEGPIETKCPASALQKHNDVTVLLDKKAASLLKKN